ncbi:MAG: hypothetical protein SFU99_11610 [Saprospiraceae bacterium]|nr:hypothetical protein [Saprospiraceae bacterium]
MKNLLYMSVLVLLLTACNKSEQGNGAPGSGNVAYQDVNIADYTVEDVPETDWQRAIKLDSLGNPIEMGFFDASGKKVGTWITYHLQKLFPQQIATYKNGKLNGIFVQGNQFGQIELIAHYQNNNLHGSWAKYRFARLIEKANYTDGKLDGIFEEYKLQTGKLLNTSEYKNGVRDGYFRTYDENGQVTSEYLYRNGEQVSENTATNSKN